MVKIDNSRDQDDVFDGRVLARRGGLFRQRFHALGAKLSINNGVIWLIA